MYLTTYYKCTSQKVKTWIHFKYHWVRFKAAVKKYKPITAQLWLNIYWIQNVQSFDEFEFFKEPEATYSTVQFRRKWFVSMCDPSWRPKFESWLLVLSWSHIPLTFAVLSPTVLSEQKWQNKICYINKE